MTMNEEQNEPVAVTQADAPVEAPKEPNKAEEKESDVIDRPKENYREEDIAETIGSLRISRKYGIAHLPKLNIDAYIPSYLLLKEVDDQKETRVWKFEVTLVKKYVGADGKEISKEDVISAIDNDDYTHLRNSVAYTRQNYEMTKEKKNS